MALTTPAKIETRLGLTPFLFNLNSGNPTADQAALDAIVTDAIADADAELQYRLKSNYSPAGDLNAQRMQATAEAYLAADYLLLILRAQKTFGTHAPLLSEESDSYERLEAMGFREIAEGLLSPWITIAEEQPGRGFSAPVLLMGAGVDTSLGTTSQESEQQELEDQLSTARSFNAPQFSTVAS